MYDGDGAASTDESLPRRPPRRSSHRNSIGNLTTPAALLRESNGVEGDGGEGFIWSTERITSENERLREDAELASLYMPFGSLLFFTDAGNGDLFVLLPASTGLMSSSGTTRTTAIPGVVPLVCDGSSCLGVI
ncbi:hypothetical protein HEK616_84660 (plasmid) [Streptomyces nigrescens]|uniref:Uncharacterized protein n=1 Tax=Streptomyces nigrescens TaxID=1920 RepID=A0ABM8A8U0_STRNI|nr:hypothetical protein HEK616_84660 [Streptomyces nigrescens]